MIVKRFIEWCETANSRERAEGFVALARSVVEGKFAPRDRESAVIALHLVVDDPSPKVRLAVADQLGEAVDAPRSLVKALLFDTDEIAIRIARSPALESSDLIDALKQVSPVIQSIIAGRPCLPAVVATAVASGAHLFACRTLAANDAAALTPQACRRLAQRFGNDAEMRTALLEREDVPADVRQILILEVGRCLESSAFVLGVVGERRARRVAFETCERATSKIAEWVEVDEIPDLVEHLRVTGQISPAFLVRAACAGNIDLLAASLTALSGLAQRRVRAIVADCRDRSFLSLARSCGLDDTTATLLRMSIQQWKRVATGSVSSETKDVPDYVMQRVLAAYRLQFGGRPDAAVAALLGRLEGEIARDSMRDRLTELMAA